MRGRRVTGLVAAAVVGLSLVACADKSETSEDSGDPSGMVLEEVKAPDGTELQKVILEPLSVERLGIRLEPIAQRGADLVVPYAAVVYDPEGGTWVFTEPEPNSFLRHRVTVREIAGDEAFLSDGPEPGTEVVTVATAELYGAEEGLV
jgi:hypothetical protein